MEVTSFPKKFNVLAIKNRPRTAIVIANMIKYSIIKCEKDYIIITASYNDDNIIIINMYSPPMSDFSDSINILEYYLN